MQPHGGSIKSRRGIVVLVGAVLIVGFLFNRFIRTHSIEVVHPEIGPAVEAVYATGTVEPEVMLPIAPRMTARLRELNVDEGALVEKGQQLAKLEDEDMQGALNQLRAREKFAESQYKRYNESIKTHAISLDALEKAKFEWEAAQAATAQAEAQAGFMTLAASESGKIIQRDGEVGQLIPANQAIFWIAASGMKLRITAEVDEEDIGRVQVGQSVLIRADAFPGQTFHGTVKTITPKGDPVGRSYRVRIDLQEQQTLQIGMTAEANIIIRENKNSILVPATAVRNGKIWKITDGKITEVSATLGAKGADKVEIIKDLSIEDLVALSPNPDRFKPGDSVRTNLVDAAKVVRSKEK